MDISKTFGKVSHEGLILKLSRNGIFGNLLNVLRGFIKHQKQRLLLIYRNSSWKNITSGIPKESFSVPFLFLSYIKNLSESLFSNWILFGDDTSLFSVVYHVNLSSFELNIDLKKNWWKDFQWKMSVYPDSTKPTQEAILSHPSITFSNNLLRLSYSETIAISFSFKINF